MVTRPVTIGILAFTATVVGAGTFAVDPQPFDQAAAIVVLAGVIVVGLTGLVGLVLARAPWGRWTLLASVVLSLVLAAIPGTAGFWITLAIGTPAIVALLGPWLTLWVRHEPSADAPGPVVIALIAVAPVAPLFVGLSALGGLRPAHIVLIVVASVSSWAYGRGILGGIWSLRLGVPVAGAAATAATIGAGQVMLGVAVVAVTIASWLPQARHATAVITPPLPEPTKRPPRDTDHAPH
ncbi:MAG: hypothetical protein M3092_07790 [Actinomycetia bacterium]|nr:hypothetical protein [Actinomycetes bacterium]